MIVMGFNLCFGLLCETFLAYFFLSNSHLMLTIGEILRHSYPDLRQFIPVLYSVGFKFRCTKQLFSFAFIFCLL